LGNDTLSATSSDFPRDNNILDLDNDTSSATSSDIPSKVPTEQQSATSSEMSSDVFMSNSHMPTDTKQIEKLLDRLKMKSSLLKKKEMELDARERRLTQMEKESVRNSDNTNKEKTNPEDLTLTDTEGKPQSFFGSLFGF
jgi:hypothetical protein